MTVENKDQAGGRAGIPHARTCSEAVQLSDNKPTGKGDRLMNFKPKIEDPLEGKASLMEQLIDAISDCVPTIGTGEFSERFMHIVMLIGAGQATAFAYEAARAHCLLSRNFLAEEKSGTLAAIYADGRFREDPLFGRVMKMGENDCVVSQLEDSLSGMSSQYLTAFFGEAGWRTKVAILIVQGSLRMVLNLYFVSGSTCQSSQPLGRNFTGIYRLIGKMLATHFLSLNPLGFPHPLVVLSERERQVCIGMLAGKKSEIIADEIGVATSSVVTYRQRAYQKLGISSRGQLFSICRS